MSYLGPSLRREKLKERPVRRTGTALLASLALNALVLWALAAAGAFQLAAKPDKTRVALAPISLSQWEANRKLAAPNAPRTAPTTPQAAPPRSPAPLPDDEKVHGQEVDVAPSDDSRRPPDAKFLSEHDNTVAKETRSRHAGEKLYENTLPAPSDGVRDRSRPEAGDGGQAARTAPGSEKRSNGTGADRQQIPDQRERERLALAPDPNRQGPSVAPRRERERVPGAGDVLGVPGLPDAAQRKKGDPRDLLPEPGSMQRIVGGPSADYLKGVEEGDATALTTRSFKYAGFMNRVLRAVVGQWDPVRAYAQRDPEGNLFANKDRTTVFVAVMDPSGALEAVKIAESCGLDFLDNEGVRATRAAAPFPNPPSGLIDADGKIRIAFGLVLQARNESRVRVYVPSMPPSMQRPYPDR